MVNPLTTNLCRFRYLDVGYVPGEEMCPKMQPGNLELAISEILEVLAHRPTHEQLGSSFSYQNKRGSRRYR